MQDILLNILMWLITTLSNIFVKPIMLLIGLFLPDISDYIVNVKTFFNTNIFSTMRFAIRLLYNVTGIPRSVILFGFTYLALKIALHIGMKAYKLIIRVWGIVKP